jgi:hypothetical protein
VSPGEKNRKKSLKERSPKNKKFVNRTDKSFHVPCVHVFVRGLQEKFKKIEKSLDKNARLVYHGTLLAARDKKIPVCHCSQGQ